MMFVVFLALVGCNGEGPESDELLVERSFENVGDQSLEGHTPRGFSGQGVGLFTGDNLNPGFPDGDGVQAFTTIDLATVGIADALRVDSATLTIPESEISGTPFQDLGALVAEEVMYDAFSRDLFDLAPTTGGFSCTLATSADDTPSCDATELVAAAIAAEADTIQLRIRFETAGDNDGQGDLIFFNTDNANEVVPGLVVIDATVAVTAE